MKGMLLYQSSEYDCGPTTLINAIRFLYEREEIPPALIKAIWNFGNDTFNQSGELGKYGTSKAAMRYISEWFNCYAAGCSFPLKTRYYDDEQAAIVDGSPAIRCLQEGGTVLMRCFSGGYGHYVLLTGIAPQGIELFDPYEENMPYTMEKDGIMNIEGYPRRLNRIVTTEVLNRFTTDDYAAGTQEHREVLLFWRTDRPADQLQTLDGHAMLKGAAGGK